MVALEKPLSPQKATYPSPSRCQIGPGSQRSSASLSKHSQRSSAVGAQAKQEPVGNTAQMSEGRSTPPGWEERPQSYAAPSVPTLIPLSAPKGVGVGEWR